MNTQFCSFESDAFWYKTSGLAGSNIKSGFQSQVSFPFTSSSVQNQTWEIAVSFTGFKISRKVKAADNYSVISSFTDNSFLLKYRSRSVFPKPGYHLENFIKIRIPGPHGLHFQIALSGLSLAELAPVVSEAGIWEPVAWTKLWCIPAVYHLVIFNYFFQYAGSWSLIDLNDSLNCYTFIEESYFYLHHSYQGILLGFRPKHVLQVTVLQPIALCF